MQDNSSLVNTPTAKELVLDHSQNLAYSHNTPYKAYKFPYKGGVLKIKCVDDYTGVKEKIRELDKEIGGDWFSVDPIVKSKVERRKRLVDSLVEYQYSNGIINKEVDEMI